MVNDTLKRRRIQLSISQQELADHLGYNRCTISRLENGLIRWKYEDVVKSCELLRLKIIIKEK